MKATHKITRVLAALAAGVGALILALASANIASAQTNTTNGPNATLTNGIRAGANMAADGQHNSAYGNTALRFNTTGDFNNAFGSLALTANVTGNYNTGIGYGALNSNTESFNTSVGCLSLNVNTTGTSNTAIGFQALFNNTIGGFNVAIGDGALLNNTTGGNNISIGEDGGINLTTGSDNIYIGSPGGTAGESRKIRIGTQGTHTDTFLTGVIHGNGSQLTNIPAASLAGQITTAQIANAAVTKANIANAAVNSNKLAANLTLAGTTTGTFSGNLTGNATTASSAVIFTGSLAGDIIGKQSATMIVDAAVTAPKISNGAVTSSKIAPSAVMTASIADEAVTAPKLADAAVTNLKIATAAVSTSSIIDTAVTSAKLASNLTLDGTTVFAGAVGIGTSTPGAPLGVEATQALGQFVSTANVNGSLITLKNLTASPTYLGGINFQNAASTTRGSIAYAGDDTLRFYAAGVERMRILGNGNVGIGNSNPGSPLDVQATRAGGRFVSTADVNGSIIELRNQTASPTFLGAINFANAALTSRGSIAYSADDNLRFFVAEAARMTIAANGSVGIGTATPTHALLEIEGGAGSFDYGARGFLTKAGASTTTFPGTATGISVWASGNIYAAGFIAYSDARIKNIDGPSDTARDLSTLLGIEVTDYSYIDTVSKGAGKQKKVIAQQVEKVYPQAVSRSTEAVPDIYQHAEFKDGWAKLATNLKKGERVRLIGNKKHGIHEVLEVEEGRFRTDFAADGDTVFVYGREVKDYRAVDYEAIAMLNVSATQQLKKEKDAEIAQLRGDITTLHTENTALAEKLAALEARDQAREVRLTRLEDARNSRPTRLRTVNAPIRLK